MKKSIKIVSLILALALVFAFAGCKKTGDGDSTTAGTTLAEGQSFAPIAKDKIKVGVVHITGKDDTSGYTYAHQKGILEMAELLDLRASRFLSETMLMTATLKQQRPLFRTL